MRILVVGDEIFLLGSMQMALRRMGYDVTTAVDAGQASKILKDSRSGVDLVVTDYDMLSFGGLESIQGVRESCRHCVPVILITGHSGAAFKEKVINSGCDGLIRKPFTIENIVSEIQRIFKEVKGPEAD